MEINLAIAFSCEVLVDAITLTNITVLGLAKYAAVIGQRRARISRIQVTIVNIELNVVNVVSVIIILD